jgi:hypothetical protein
VGSLSDGCSGRCDVCGDLGVCYPRGGMKGSGERSRRKILFGSEVGQVFCWSCLYTVQPL